MTVTKRARRRSVRGKCHASGATFSTKRWKYPACRKRVVSAIPDIFDQLTEAVEADTEEFGSTATSVGICRV